MIIQEEYNENFVRTYSDRHVYIHGGFPEADYTEAIDPKGAERAYTETNIPITEDEDSSNYDTDGYLKAQQALNTIFGGIE